MWDLFFGLYYGGALVCVEEEGTTDGGDFRQISHLTFPYPVFGRFTYILSALVVHYLERCFRVFVFEVVFAHIIRNVREQPDTGYWNSQMSDLPEVPS